MAQHEYVCQSCIHKKICPEYHEQTYSCVNHLDEADAAPRAKWISARERLPEESGMYLVFTYRGNRTVLDYSERHKIFNSFDSFSTEEANEVAIAVTHWMPLPEPPKGN